jgi:hypothetical protein
VSLGKTVHSLRPCLTHLVLRLRCGLLEKLGGEELSPRTIEEVYDFAKKARAEADANPKPKKPKVDDGHH